MSILKPGQKAPPFCLPSGPDKKICLKDFAGRPVILVFYPADWSPVCTDQLSLYDLVLPQFEQHDAAILGISTDHIWSHLAFENNRHLHFPLLSDFEPKGEVAKLYGAYDDAGGTTARALFVIDRDQKIHWSYLSPSDQNPGADGILDALESMDANRQPQGELR